MHKKMRRADRTISSSEAAAILKNGLYGVLSTADQQGCPYGIPVNYTYENETLYFHCALTGHKLDNLAENPQASFCVVGTAKLLPSLFAMQYDSVVASGMAKVVEGEEKMQALQSFIDKYSPDYKTVGRDYIQHNAARTLIVKMQVTHITGKARR